MTYVVFHSEGCAKVVQLFFVQRLQQLTKTNYMAYFQIGLVSFYILKLYLIYVYLVNFRKVKRFKNEDKLSSSK